MFSSTFIVSLTATVCLFVPSVPVYRGRHRVIAEPWSYPDDLVSEVITEPTDANEAVQPGGAGSSSGIENERFVDLSKGPPPYEGNSAQYIAKIKEELGLRVEKVCVRIFHVVVSS